MSFDILFGMKIVTEIMEYKWYGDEFISHNKFTYCIVVVLKLFVRKTRTLNEFMLYRVVSEYLYCPGLPKTVY